jgi:branched-chain amino acid transport system substrate-binding protein
LKPVDRLRRCHLGLLALPLAMPLALGIAQAAPPEPVKIGVIGPFSGPSSDFGKPMLQGIELAIDEINAVGGYLGRPLALVVKDDEGKPDVGLRGAQELMRERVVATLGFCNTGVAVKAIPVFQQAQSPLIVPCAAGAPVTTQFPAPESYVFRNAPSDGIQAPFVVNDLVRRGWTRVAIFADNTPYGEAGLQSVQAALANHRLKPAHVTRFDLGVKDLSDALRQARDVGANVVFSYTVGPENATIAKGRQAIKWDVPQVGGWPLSFPFFIQGAKGAAEGALMAQSFIAEPSNERRAAFLSAFARKHQQTMSVPMAAAQSYDATYLLAYALFSLRNGRFEGPALKAALENLPRTYYGVVATYDKPFGPDDKDAISANMLVMGMVRDGRVTFAYPEDAKRNLMVQRKPR